MYPFSLSDFGFDGIDPKGFVIEIIGGNNNIDYEGILYYNSPLKRLIYKCKAANSNNCVFKGIVFY